MVTKKQAKTIFGKGFFDKGEGYNPPKKTPLYKKKKKKKKEKE